jgi:hypothetical protein
MKKQNEEELERKWKELVNRVRSSSTTMSSKKTTTPSLDFGSDEKPQQKVEYQKKSWDLRNIELINGNPYWRRMIVKVQLRKPSPM